MKQNLLSLLILSGVFAVILGTVSAVASSDNLISHWNLNEISGMTFADSVGSNDAACSGTGCPITTTGVINGALLFDGVDDGLDVADDLSLDWTVDDSFSIVAWIKGTQDCSGNKVVIGKRGVSGSANWWLGCVDNSGTDVANLQLRDSTGLAANVTGDTVINDGNWHQLVATWDTTSMHLFVDGVEENTQTIAFTGAFSNTRQLTIGYYNISPFYWFEGAIDEVKLYSVAVIPTLITSTPVEAAVVDQPYTYTVTADGNPAPTFSLLQFPAGMTIDANTGLISWTPTTAGSFVVEVEADNEVRTETQAFTIEVIDVVVTKSLGSPPLDSGAPANFTIAITNTSSVTLDLTVQDPLELSCENALSLAAGTSISYDCTKDAVQADFTNVITVTGTYTPTTGSPVSVVASDSAFADVLPTIELSQSLEPASLPEPGGPVTVSLTITNTSLDPVTLTSLTVPPYGDVLDTGNGTVTATDCVLDEPILGGNTYSCSFSVNFAGQPGEHNIVTTAVAQDSTGNEASDEATSTITITNVPSSIAVTVTADPASIPAPGGLVTFLVEISNTSPTDSVVINSLSDQLLGSLDGEGTCSLPTASILPGGKYECSFTAPVSGVPGDNVSNQVSASGSDDDGNPVSDDGVASVTTTQNLVFLPFITVDN
ncbi:MAG: LamG domain-containing protein [Anaerolineaceae bacterium]|nr:LamG domain-containing protein [Anaerolineaceae bacterium]